MLWPGRLGEANGTFYTVGVGDWIGDVEWPQFGPKWHRHSISIHGAIQSHTSLKNSTTRDLWEQRLWRCICFVTKCNVGMEWMLVGVNGFNGVHGVHVMHAVNGSNVPYLCEPSFPHIHF